MKTIVATVLAVALLATAVTAGGSKRPCTSASDTDCDPPGGGGDGHHHHKDCDDDKSDVNFYTLNVGQCLAVDLQLINIKQWTVKLKGDTLEAWFTLLVADPDNFLVSDEEPKGGIGSVVASSCNPTHVIAASGPEPLDLKSKCDVLGDGIFRITGKVEIAKKSALAIARDADKRGTFVITTTFTAPGGKVVGCVQSLVGFCTPPDSDSDSCDKAAGTAAGTKGDRKHHHDKDKDDDDDEDDVNLSQLQCGTCAAGCSEPIVKKCANLLGLRNSCGQSFGQSADKCCFANCCAALNCDSNTQTCDADKCQCKDKPCSSTTTSDPPCKANGH